MIGYDLFKPINLNSFCFKNRILRSATHEGMADSAGAPTKQLIDTYVKFAKGGVGGIIILEKYAKEPQ